MGESPEMGSTPKNGESFNTQDDIVVGTDTQLINASGHPDQLKRQYGILSICGMALTVDNAWVAIGTSLNVAICESSIPPTAMESNADLSLNR